MKRARWGFLISSVASVGILAGCVGNMPYRVVKRQTYDEFLLALRLNESANSRISSLISENGRLKDQLDNLTKVTNLQDIAMLALQVELDAKIQRTRNNIGPLPPGVTLETAPGGVALRIEGQVLFDPGQAILKPSGKKTLGELAKKLVNMPNHLEVAGYTDSDPISRSSWKTNFNLSGARALAVLNYLIEQGVPASKMHFAGYGEHKLIRLPSGIEVKAKSRRVEIIILSPTAEETAETLSRGEMLPEDAPPK